MPCCGKGPSPLKKYPIRPFPPAAVEAGPIRQKRLGGRQSGMLLHTVPPPSSSPPGAPVAAAASTRFEPMAQAHRRTVRQSDCGSGEEERGGAGLSGPGFRGKLGEDAEALGRQKWVHFPCEGPAQGCQDKSPPPPRPPPLTGSINSIEGSCVGRSGGETRGCGSGWIPGVPANSEFIGA